MTQLVEFKKYHGLGNDFILIDNRHTSDPILTPETVVTFCDRRFGIGADGVIFLLPGAQGAAYSMRILNSDGSEPEMCGNGIRCLAQFLHDLNLEAEAEGYPIHTLAGRIVPKLEPNGLITVDMGEPRLPAAEIPTTLGQAQDPVIEAELEVDHQHWSVTCVSMGNPHCVTFVDDLTPLSLTTLGPQFEHHPAFPKRVNTEFVQVISPQHLKMQVWERGAGATLACGTGACAVLVAAVLTQRSETQAVVELPGGPLTIRWDQVSNHIFMSGPAQAVFSGVYPLP